MFRLILLQVLLCAPVLAQRTVDLRFVRADVHEAIIAIAVAGAQPVQVAADVTGAVTAAFPDVAWEIALRSVVDSVGAELVADAATGVWRVRNRAPVQSTVSRTVAAEVVDGAGGGVKQVDRHTIIAAKDLLRGHPANNPDGSVNVVVEIPTGSTAKWEVDKADGALKWEFKDGRPRVVSFLGYPGNYGMVPRTLLSEAAGGDGDPLDVIVLGGALPRGTVVPVRLVGVLALSDGGERDDKLIAVRADSPLGNVANMDALREQFPGAAKILETWFTSYKGPGVITSRGFAGADSARATLEAAAQAFEAAAGAQKD